MREKTLALAERHWWAVPLLVFLVGQLLSFGLLAFEKDRQEPIPAGDGYQAFVKAHEADPAWPDYVAGWNGQAYREIATAGYPETPPRTTDGRVLPNEWAFFPLYPLILKALMILGLPFWASAVGVSLVTAAGAFIILFALVRRFTGGLAKPTVAVISLALWPAAPIFQLAYPEGLAALLIVGTLYSITEKKYGLAAVLILLLGLTRPVGPPDFVLVALHGLYLGRAYLWPAASWPEGLRRLVRSREGLAHLGLLAVSGVAAVLWPLLTRLATGENAFFEARAAYSSESYFGQWFRYALLRDDAYPLTPLFIVVVFLILALLQLANKSLPGLLRVWPLILLSYLLIVTQPAGNEYRYFMLGFLVYPWLRLPTHRVLRGLYWPVAAGAVVLALYMQHEWVHTHWIAAPGELRKAV